MKYAVYFTWNDDGTRDSINCDNALDRDLNLKELIKRKEFSDICWCKIYASGEYGRRYFVREHKGGMVQWGAN
jgi:hypothetical protein